MSRFPVIPYDEQILIQEVRYLHSLWHQGPPQPHVHPNLHPQTPVSLQPSDSTQFKKQKKQKSKRLKEALTDSGVGWVFTTPDESSPVTESGWPSFTARQNSQPHLPTAEELAGFAGNRAQQQGLKAVSEYLKYSIDNDDEDMYDDEDDDDMEVEKEDKYLDFFTKLFEEDGGLREYYEKNSESGGEFSCLVCSGVGKKGWRKKFKDCVALVQHSITISNTRQAHRAYGQAICRILGWDINRLPSIVLSAGGKPSESSDKPVEAQGKEGDGGKYSLSDQSNTRDTVNIGSSELSQQNRSSRNENQPENGGFSTTLEHKSTSEANANEDVSNDIPETAKENAEGASNCLEPLPDVIVANEENNDLSIETTIVSEES